MVVVAAVDLLNVEVEEEVEEITKKEVVIIVPALVLGIEIGKIIVIVKIKNSQIQINIRVIQNPLD